MRRTDRQITDVKEITSILDTCKVCRVAINDDRAPYIVPLNYGYSYENESLSLFFHCAKEGKKLDLINVNNNVSFEMDTNHQLVVGKKACNYGYAYSSIYGVGTIEIVDNYNEKVLALNKIMNQYTGQSFEFDDKSINSVVVLKLNVENFSAKGRKANK